jgi:hypothetical protein
VTCWICLLPITSAPSGKLLGHLNSKTTERYAHLAADPVRRAADVVSGALAKAMGEIAAADRTYDFNHRVEGSRPTALTSNINNLYRN